MPDGALTLYGPDNRPLHRIRVENEDSMTEVCRSFSYKLNAQTYGGAQYESRDFFCSEKTMCRKSEEEDASLAIFSFCKRQVLRDVRDYIEEIQERRKDNGQARISAPKQEKEEKPAKQVPGKPLQGSVDHMWSLMTTPKASIEILEKLKASLVKMLGEVDGDRTYQSKLFTYGVDSVAEFKRPQDARNCAKDLLEIIQAHPATQAA